MFMVRLNSYKCIKLILETSFQLRLPPFLYNIVFYCYVNCRFKKKKKKKNGVKKIVGFGLKNDKAALKVEQFYKETRNDNFKYLNEINISVLFL